MNRKCKFLIVLSLIFIVATLQVQAEKYKGAVVKAKNSPKASANCLPPGKTTELSLNLVRAYLKTNGTMWFRENAEYEVPKGSGKTSMFSAALWIGGVDIAGQLYVAAMRFGQVGNDYWTGPLKMKDGSIDQPTCSKFDRFFPISRLEVQRHIEAFKTGDPGYVVPKSILEWPATSTHMNVTGTSWYLAPYQTWEGNDPTRYNPEAGDYPYYDFENDLCPWTEANKARSRQYPWLEGGVPSPQGRDPNPAALPMPPERVWTRNHQEYGWDNMMIYADHVLKGDETIFWFLNDKGGPHTESKSDRSIGLEIRVQAFAFATNDELNKMTFYSYEIINRGSNTLYDTYFSQWVDPDLGYAWDDYVGCDVNRGMGYCYNGYEIDGKGEAWAYGANPPAIGVDFFQGPYIDPDGSDNPRFHKEFADFGGTEAQKEYCRRFVDYVVGLNPKDPNSYYVVPALHPDSAAAGVLDTLRYNNQFAINGVNFGDSIIDNERFGMRRFVYHNNKPGPTGDPENAIHYYNLLRGIWKNNQRMTYGGDGFQFPNNIQCDFMFPKGTDYCNWGTKGISPGETYGHGGRTGNWSEEHPEGINSKPNDPDDRRFMQSAGPFTLRQGACNYITVGIPWARASSGGVAASVALLMVADDKCQALFENCFKILDGPDAPTLTIREYDQKLILLLTNSELSNNVNESYQELDPTIPDTLALPWLKEVDNKYRFEGYQIYQVIGPEIGANDLDNPSLARLVRQFDIVNFVSDPEKPNYGEPIGRLINWEFDEDMQVSVPREKVSGANSGIQHSFEITQDAFAIGNSRLVNYRTYYFIAVAYAYNEFWPFSIDPIGADKGLLGQKLPYLRGRKTAEGKSVTPIAAVPHPPYVHGGGLTLHSDYGSIPNITRIDGQGNGGIALELTQKTIDKIVRGGDKGDYRVAELEYEKDAGPLGVKVIDPLRVKPFDYTIIIKEPDSEMHNSKADISNNAYWVLMIDETVSDAELKEAGLVVNPNVPLEQQVVIRHFGSDSTTKIVQYNEHLILPLGISISIKNTDFINIQPEVLKHWDADIVGSYSNPNNVFQMPLSNAIYRAKLLYCQSEKIDIENDIVFSNNSRPWITGLVDDNTTLPSNWIRAGSNNLGRWNSGETTDVSADYGKWRLEDAFHNTVEVVDWTQNPSTGQMQRRGTDRAFKDYSGKFGTLCGGTWAPYVLTSPFDNGPQAKYIAPEPVWKENNNGEIDVTEPAIWYWNFNFNRNNFLQVPMRQPGYNQTMTNLYSVDIVITPDKSLWTRAIVLESCPDSAKSEGKALRNEPRKAISRDKNGNPEPNATDGFGELGNEGMSWFPGYAINIETGERLNIMFSENSDYTLNDKFGSLINGRDMIFNPTATYAIATKDTMVEITTEFGNLLYWFTVGQVIPKSLYDFLFVNYELRDSDRDRGRLAGLGIERVWGGMHYVYVCNSAGNTSGIYYMNPASAYPPAFNNFLRTPRRNHNHANERFAVPGTGTVPPPEYGGFIDTLNNGKVYYEFECGPYDESRWLVQKFKQVLVATESPDMRRHSYRLNYKMQLFNNVMYTHIPMQPMDPELQRLWMTSDVTYKIRVSRPYMRYISRWYEHPDDREYDIDKKEFDYKGFPVYKMSTKELAPTFNDTRVYQTVLDNINIVPNPYYGGSLYERNALETTVKIINLPTDLKNSAPVTINIFTVSGILVRTLTKGDSETSYVDWDLKNFANIPIAGGVYIIHVNCPGIGERMLKFFCTMRPTDLNTF